MGRKQFANCLFARERERESKGSVCEREEIEAMGKRQSEKSGFAKNARQMLVNPGNLRAFGVFCGVLPAVKKH